MECERCGAKPEGFEIFDYCDSCGKNLCSDCMKRGCCDKVPAESGAKKDEEKEAEARDLP
jgi:hypothetical protein